MIHNLFINHLYGFRGSDQSSQYSDRTLKLTHTVKLGYNELGYNELPVKANKKISLVGSGELHMAVSWF